MNRTEYIGKLNALYVGEKNCLEELITAYDEKNKEIEKLKNIIKEVREYIQDRYDGEVLTHTFDKDNVKELYDILRGDKE